MATESFTPALDLSGAFYAEAVRPLLAGRAHSAALLGWARTSSVTTPIARPITGGGRGYFRGWPVRYGWDNVTPQHHVTVTSLSTWLLDWLGVDATANLSVHGWLILPQQRLLGVVAGRVYADDRAALARVRRSLAWYPDQVWRWLLACQWRRLAQEEAFVARAAEVGDELGSAVTAARLVRDMMRLALLLARRYAPYQKWLGTAFAHALRHDDDLPMQLATVVHAHDVRQRELALGRAWSALARRHNNSGLTEPLDTTISNYYGRPAQVLMAGRFSEALLATVTDPALRRLELIGGVDQIVDSTDILQVPHRYFQLAGLYATE